MKENNDKKITPSAPVHHLAFLQAFLYEIFSSSKKCENNFKYTEWYLEENFSVNEINLFHDFFRSKEVKCDCDVLKKIDIRELLDESYNFHK